MRKRILKILSLVMTGALFTQAMPIMANTVDIPVDIDRSIYDQLADFNDGYDINGDGVISEEEFKNIDFIYINLDNVKDISSLKKAEGLRSIDLSGGSITDFSVLSGLKNLRRITINNNPVKDVSYFKNMDLNFLYLDGTNVSVEDRISMIQTKDFEIPVGFIENFNLKPSGMIKTEMVIQDNEIAGFGEDGVASIDEGFYNDIIAKKAGETTYSVMYDGKEIAKGKIKVVPSEVKNPQSDLSGIKVDKIESVYRNGKPMPCILTEDNKYYNYKHGKFVLAADNVKTAYGQYISSADMNDGEFILKNDGSFTINGKSVFGDNTKVSEICNDYAITDDGSLWFITVNGDVIEKTKICSNCEKFENDRLVSKKDGTVILVFCSTQKNKFDKANIYEIGKMNIVHVHNMDDFILDDQGNIWNLNTKNYYSAPDVKLAAKNAVKLGAVVLNGSLSRAVYAGADGKVYYCHDGKELTSVTADDIVENDDYDYYTIYDGIYEKKDTYAFMDKVTVAGVEICNDDRIYGRSVLYRDKSLYMTCLGRYMAVSDVKESYGAFYDNAANDYSILILRNDNTLWEYRIGADTLTQVTEEKLSVADVISLIRYMTGGSTLTDSQVEKYDMNADGNINLLDIILMKNKIIGDKK